MTNGTVQAIIQKTHVCTILVPSNYFDRLEQEVVKKAILEYPVIGIRPTIDGRRNGVREALEEKTQHMAREVSKLIFETLRYPDGTPVKTLVAESTIGGVVEAAQCAALFSRHAVCGVLTVTPSWGYGTETIDMDPLIPKAIWGFNGTERPGAVYLACAVSSSEQLGLPVYKIYGRNIQDMDDDSIPEDAAADILRFARAAVAVGWMKGYSYLSMGGVSMGIGSSMVDVSFFQNYLGMRNEFIDMSEFQRRIQQGIYDKKEFERAAAWVRSNCKEAEDPNPAEKRRTAEQKAEDWRQSVLMAMIARDLMHGNPELAYEGWVEESAGHNALAAGFQGQRNWTDFMPTGDFMEALLNSSFDWNGIRPPMIVATENDSLNAVSMLFGFLLTGRAQIFADVRTYWSPQSIERICAQKADGQLAEGFIYLTNSGAATLDGTGRHGSSDAPAIKPHWQVTEHDVQACLDATRWCPAKLTTFRGGGYSSSYQSRGGMPMTMVRLNLLKHQGPVLQFMEGWSIDLPGQVREKVIKRTDPTWPKTFFVPRTQGSKMKDVYTVMKTWGSNHCALSYGHIGADLLTLASMLRIPVSMHNVNDDSIFRPHAWNSLGIGDSYSSDFRACALYGPIYGKYQ